MRWVGSRVEAGWGRVSQVLMSRPVRQVWLLLAFSMVLVCLYTYNTVNPTEPYFKRSTTTGGDSVVVIFADKNVNSINSNNNNNNDKAHNPDLHLPDRSYTPAAASALRGIEVRTPGVRFKEIPFSAEKPFDLNKVFRRLNSTNPLPQEDERIPEGVLQMVEDNQDSSKKESAPPRGNTGVKNSGGPVPPPASKSTDPHKELGSASSKNIAEPSAQPQKQKSAAQNIPDWVLSIFSPEVVNTQAGVSALERIDANEANKIDVVYSDLLNIDEPRQIPDEKEISHQGEIREGPHLMSPEAEDAIDVEREDSVDVDNEGVFFKLFHPEGNAKQHDPKAAKTRAGTHGTAGDVVADTSHTGHSAADPKTVDKPDLEHHDADAQDSLLDIDQLSQLLDPDDPDLMVPENIQQLKDTLFHSPGVAIPSDDDDEEIKPPERNEASRAPAPYDLDLDLDIFSSTEKASPLSVHLTKRQRRTGKLVYAAHIADKNDAESVTHKPAATGDHDNKKVKKLLENSLKHLSLNDPDPSDGPGVQHHDIDGDHAPDTLLDRALGHQITDKSNKPDSVLNPTKTETQVSDDNVAEEPEKTQSDSAVQSHKSDLNLTLWKGVLKERKRLLRAKCQTDISRQNVQDTQAIVDRKRNFLYCPVGESAPGFFHRLMFSLKHNNRSAREFPSPFDIPLQTALAEDFDTVSKFHRKGLDEFMAGSLRFVVVRDPFSRLYAAYVDRLLVPDSVYWKKWGIPTITQHRKYPSSKSLTCGHDVTFAEFVKYVISTLHESDDIVKPVNVVCAPCDVRFSIIGHVETLVSDIEYTLSLLKLSIADFTAETFMNDVNDDIITESAFKAFEDYQQMESCITKYEMGKRLWRNLQIHGIISEELHFSFAPKKVEKMTASQFVKLVQEARQVLPETERVQQQKIEALKAAFENVPFEDIMQLVKLYSVDFELFGYDKHPSFLL